MTVAEVTLKEHLTAVVDLKTTTLEARIAELSARNAADNAAVKASLAEIKAHLERREEKIDSELDAIKATISRWSGAIAVGVVIIVEIIRRVFA